MADRVNVSATINITNPNTNASAPSYTYDGYMVAVTNG
jgi:hypothetical protein